ncbi:MAG: hypothetical protein WBX01_02545 [Nitrososphaeraceae archaeon]
MEVVEQGPNPLSQFFYALKAPETRRQWPNRLKVVFDYLGLHGNLDEQAKQFMNLCKEGSIASVQEKIIEFISYQVRRAQKGEISVSTIPNYLKAMKLFCEMNDIHVSWRKISRGVPRGRQAANDRAPTREEIERLLQYPDRRIKPVVLTMISSGIRIGAWDFLKWKHVKPYHNENGEVIAAKLNVYAEEPDEYYSFIDPRSYASLKEWMDFRASYGETITNDSWLMRDIWQTTNTNYGAKLGLATAPKRLKSSGIKRLLERALWEQGIREPLKEGKCYRIMNNTTVVLATVIFALVGILVFAAITPYLSEEANAARCGPRGDENDKEPGCGHQPGKLVMPPKPGPL